MEKQILEKIRERHGFFPLLLNLFLIVLAIYVISATRNNIKERGYIGQEVERVNTITVSGEGEIAARPDLALVNFSVIYEAKAVEDAISGNAAKMNAVIEFLKGQGIEERDLKTASFNIYPRYEYYDNYDHLIHPEGRRVLVAYEVSQRLQVKIREMEKIGDIIQGATDAGANDVSGLSFTIDNQDELKDQAREQAIDQAKEKAEVLASQLNVNLVRIIGFSEGGVSPVYRGYAEIADAEGAGGAPSIETGESEIRVNVSIIYEIN